MKNYSRIIVTGSIAYDEIMNFPDQFINYLQADKLHQLNVSFVVNKLEKQLGGTANNIAYNAKLMTDKEVILLSSMGKDYENFMKLYKEMNINTEYTFIDKELYTATGKVITDIKDNQIWGFYYGACERDEYIDLMKFSSEDTLMILSATHSKPFMKLQEQAIAYQFDYVYDPGMNLTWITDNALRVGVVNCKWLVGNDYEIAQVERRIGYSINDLVAQGIKVIITLGDQGVKYRDTDQEITIPAYKLEKVSDPTGAGDAWRGAFMAGIIEGKPVEDCLKQANALASYAVEMYGTVNHRPTKEEINERVKSLA